MTFTYQSLYKPRVYFFTLYVHENVDVFTRQEYIELLIESLKLYQEDHGLQIYEWLLMSNHLHLIVSSDKDDLTDILTDFRKFTTLLFSDAIINNHREIRKKWLLKLLRNGKEFIFWREKYYSQEINTVKFYHTKKRYINLKPVRAGLVENEWEYLLSSFRARYFDKPGLLELSECRFQESQCESA